MTDEELLKLAAKAAGMTLTLGGYIGAIREDENGRRWNPLEDDGDALRLAVKLQFRIDIMPWGAIAQWNAYNSTGSGAEQHKDDPYKATRRAIVRAAAEIGKTMKDDV
jgi:hypothetical protein